LHLKPQLMFLRALARAGRFPTARFSLPRDSIVHTPPARLRGTQARGATLLWAKWANPRRIFRRAGLRPRRWSSGPAR